MVGGALLALAAGCAAGSAEPSAWSIVVDVDFASPACRERFAFTDASRWRWRGDDGTASLELLGDSGYEPPVRSPTSIALLKDIEVADFDLDVDVLQTGRDYGHRDLCLFFGFQSPTRYYYVHLAKTPDPHAHNVFRVADAPRESLAAVAENGIDWGDGVWHHVRIERRVANGTIRVFWDGGVQPILSAVDATFAWGRIGFGSFDDSGRIASLRVRAPAIRQSTESASPFAAAH